MTVNRSGFSQNIFEYEDGSVYDDLLIWGTSADELWDPHKEVYIEKSELPEELLRVYHELWSDTGDDYLAEYKGNYYYMLDHVYNEVLMFELKLENMEKLYLVAKQNVKELMNHKELKDALAIVSKKSLGTGPEHFVSILIDANESKENVSKMKEVLNSCMFKRPERIYDVSFLNAANSKKKISLPYDLKSLRYELSFGELFDKEQKKEIQTGIDHGLSINKLLFFAKPEFNAFQMLQIRYALESNLSFEKIKKYARPEFDGFQMGAIFKGLRSLKYKNFVEVYAKPEFDYRQMHQIESGFKHGLTVEQVMTYAKLEFNSYQMKEMRIGIEKGNSLDEMIASAKQREKKGKIIGEKTVSR